MVGFFGIVPTTETSGWHETRVDLERLVFIDSIDMCYQQRG